jgi:hypothetical protein
MTELDRFFEKLIPTTFPHGGDLLRRVPVPTFMQGDGLCVAIDSAGGETKLVGTLQETLFKFSAHHFSGIGLMLDSDNTKPAECYASIRSNLKEKTGLMFPDNAGQVEMANKVRHGVFVFPNNSDLGTLEDLLIDCAEVQYTQLLDCARNYVAEAGNAINLLNKGHRKEFNKRAGRKKAVVGAMASIFRPGKAVQASIQDNDWVRGTALKLPRIREVQRFLTELFDLPLPTT